MNETLPPEADDSRADAFLDTPVTYRVRDAMSLRASRKDIRELRADFNRWALAGFSALVAGFASIIATLVLLHV